MLRSLGLQEEETGQEKVQDRYKRHEIGQKRYNRVKDLPQLRSV